MKCTKEQGMELAKANHRNFIRTRYDNLLPWMKRKILLVTNHLLKDPDFSLLLCTDEIDIITRNAEPYDKFNHENRDANAESYDNLQRELDKLGKKECDIMAITYINYFLFEDIFEFAFVFHKEKFEDLIPMIKNKLDLNKYDDFKFKCTVHNFKED
jgi:hypothetical protein